MKLQICFLSYGEPKSIKNGLKKSLLLLTKIDENEINDIFEKINVFDYIIIDDNGIYLTKNKQICFTDFTSYNFIENVSLLQLCNTNSFLIKIDNLKMYNLLDNIFKINNIFSNLFDNIDLFDLLIIDDKAYTVRTDLYDVIFKFNRISAQDYIRNHKIKKLIKYETF